MADVLKQLVSTIGNKTPAATTPTTLYTVPASTSAMLSRIVICNKSATPATFRIAISAAASAVVNDDDWIAYDVAIGGNETINFALGCGMATGDFITVYASTANLVFSPFGIEVV